MTDTLDERLRNERDPYQLDEWGDPMSFAICIEAAGEIATLKTTLQATAEAAATHLKTAVEHQDRIEAQAAEIDYWKTEARNVRRELKSEQKQTDSAMDNYDAIHRRCEAQAAEIEKLREALAKIARLRTDLSGDFSLGSHQSDIARAALGETK